MLLWARAWFLGIVSITVPLCVWEAVSRTHLVSALLLPPPTHILAVLEHLFATGAVLQPLAYTMTLLAVGYATASALGVGLGVAMGYSPAAAGLLQPLVELIRPIPKPALVPPLFLFFGIGPTTMVVIVVLAAFFPVLIAAAQGVKGVDKVLIDTARVFRISPFSLITKIVLPSALPMILTGMRVSLALSLALVILAEMIAGEAGVGYLILDMQRSFRFTEMYCWVLLLAAIGYLLNLLFEAAEKRIIRWNGQ